MLALAYAALATLEPLSALADTSLFEGFFEHFPYLAPFSVLILCGLGAPFPEEVALIGSGLLLYKGEVRFLPITLVCSSAILLGDALPFWLGRRYGMTALKRRWVRRLLHPERIALLEKRFVDHGNWVVFTCRFLPGVRIPGYFFAGTMRMPFTRFFLLDLLGVLISVPASIWLGKLFGESVERLRQRFDQLHLLLAFAVVAIVLVVFVGSRNRAREREAAEAARRRDTPREAEARDEAAEAVAEVVTDAGEVASAPPALPSRNGDREEAAREPRRASVPDDEA